MDRKGKEIMYRIGRELGTKLALWKDSMVADEISDVWDNENETTWG
jgi:hypothetical protein